MKIIDFLFDIMLFVVATYFLYLWCVDNSKLSNLIFASTFYILDAIKTVRDILIKKFNKLEQDLLRMEKK